MDEFRGRYQVIDLGWIHDADLLARAYNASDIFLMPSTAETFGMMAIEAMACGKPVIVFEGTSLPEVTFAPTGGIAVPYGDTNALRFALERLIDNPLERQLLGQNALNLARQHYGMHSHVDRLVELYQEVIARRSAEAQ
jgi:glycosyltransferase involved in cell wall biosynthesis